MKLFFSYVFDQILNPGYEYGCNNIYNFVRKPNIIIYEM